MNFFPPPLSLSFTGLSFTHGFQGTVPPGGMSRLQEFEVAAHLAHLAQAIHKQEVKCNECLCSAHFLLFTETVCPAQEMMLPAVEVDFLTSINQIRKFPHRHA